MNKHYSLSHVFKLILGLALICWTSSCSDDDPKLEDNTVAFEASSLGLTDETATITLNLSRSVSADVTVYVSYTTDGVTYGDEFTTDPEATDNSIAVTISAGETSGAFTVSVADDAFLDGDETATFTIASFDSSTDLVVGTTTELVLTFGAIVSEGSELTLQGLAGDESGSSAANSVFVNFRSNSQTPVLRSSWDLAFYNGDEFRVMINNTNGASAIQIDETDITAVDTDDADTDALAIPLGSTGEESFAMIDDVYGDLDNTVIDAISSTDSDNKVYLINREGGTWSSSITAEDLVKIRVTQTTDGGYTLEYANITSTTYSTLTITKDESTNFSYVSFEDEGASATSVSVEPDDWEIEWTWSIYVGGSGDDIYPYGFADVVFINYLGGVTAAKVLTDDVTYDDYDETYIDDTEFSSERNVIGSDWRATTGSSVGVYTDRFYVIKDSQDNYYKLKFVSFTADDSGTRGKPVIAYELVQSGS